MAATVAWRQAMDARGPAERARILREAASPEAVEEALAEVLKRAGAQPAEGLKYAEVACAMADAVGMPKLQSAASRVLGQTLRALGEHAAAVDALEAAARYAMDAGDEMLALQSRVGIVDSLGWLERYQEAEALAQELVQRFLRSGDLVDAGKVLVNQANVYHRQDRFQKALDACAEGLKLMDGRVPPKVVAQVQTNMASILTHMNRVREAMAKYDQARSVFLQESDLIAAAVVDINVGFLRYISGQHSAAIKAFTQARKTFESMGRRLDAAKVDADMADAYRALNLLPEALKCYDDALAVFREFSLTYEIARTQLGRAIILASFGRFEEAQAALAEARKLFRSLKNTPQLGHTALIEAHVLRQDPRGNKNKAEERAEEASRKLRESGLLGWAAEADFIRFDIALEKGKDVTREMLGVVEEARAHLRSSLESRAHQSLGRYYRMIGNIEAALEHFRQGVEALDQARTLVSIEEFHVSFLRDKLSIYEDLVSTLLSRGLRSDVVEALEYVERSKSRLLLERVQSVQEEAARRGIPMDPELANRLQELRAELCRHYHSLHVFDGAEQMQRRVGVALGSRDELQRVEQEYREALREAELTYSAETTRVLGRPVSVREIQEALEEDETLVEYTVFSGQVAAFLVTRRDVLFQLNLTPLDRVEMAARRLRYHLQRIEGQRAYVERHLDALHQSVREVLAELYAMLIAPIERHLKTPRLIVVPYGVLHGLPLHAALDGDTHAIDRWEMVYSPGAAVWHACMMRERELPAMPEGGLLQAKALLMAVPLPGIELVREEVADLAKLFAAPQVFIGEEATIGAFREHAPSSEVIHLATHAVFRADNPLFSGLGFADDWLLARDLYETRLDCYLATLSACRTGVAAVESGDELFGLTRGFLAAGARSLAVSLWPADDKATKEVMESFYHNMASGLGRAAALRAAQKQTREKYPHPYHWAAFALVGAR